MENIEINLTDISEEELFKFAKKITLIQDPEKRVVEILHLLRHAQKLQKIGEGWTKWYEELVKELYGSSIQKPDIVN